MELKRHLYEKKLQESTKALSSLKKDLEKILYSGKKYHPVISPILSTPEDLDEFREHRDAKENQSVFVSPRKVKQMPDSSFSQVPPSTSPASIVPLTPDPYSHNTLIVPSEVRYNDSPFTIDNSDINDLLPRFSNLGCHFPAVCFQSHSKEESYAAGICLSFDRAFDPAVGIETDGGAKTQRNSSSSLGQSLISHRGDIGAANNHREPALSPPLIPPMTLRHRLNGERHQLQKSSSLPTTPVEATDYQTGYSCHRGLVSAKAKPSLMFPQAFAAQGGIRMMSGHRGIAPIRSMRPGLSGTSGSITDPPGCCSGGL